MAQRKGMMQTMVRMPEALRDQLATAAADNGCSMNTEICKRLTESFVGKPRYRVKAVSYKSASPVASRTLPQGPVLDEATTLPMPGPFEAPRVFSGHFRGFDC